MGNLTTSARPLSTWPRAFPFAMTDRSPTLGPVHVALSTVCLLSYSWKECLAEASRAGYRHVELLMIPGFAHVQLGEISPQELQDEAARHQVSILALHAGALDGTNEKSVQDSLAYLKRIIAFARAARLPLTPKDILSDDAMATITAAFKDKRAPRRSPWRHLPSVGPHP